MDPIIEGLQLVQQEEADVTNISLSRPVSKSRGLARATNQAVKDGVVVCVAAGNKGPDYCSVRSPGISRKAITVGAVNEDLQIASFSSRGPTPYERLVKPEIVAPGVNVEAPLPDGDGGTEMVAKTGTSFATPQVTGIASLVRAEHPNWTPARVKNSIVSTATPIFNDGEMYDVYTQGAGLVDIEQALHPDILVSDAVINFQSIRSSSEQTVEIEIENVSSEHKELIVESRVENVETDKKYENLVYTVPSKITVQPGQKRKVELYINPSHPLGIYSGRVGFTDTSKQQCYYCIFGYTRFPATEE